MISFKPKLRFHGEGAHYAVGSFGMISQDGVFSRMGEVPDSMLKMSESFPYTGPMEMPPAYTIPEVAIRKCDAEFLRDALAHTLSRSGETWAQYLQTRKWVVITAILFGKGEYKNSGVTIGAEDLIGLAEILEYPKPFLWQWRWNPYGNHVF